MKMKNIIKKQQKTIFIGFMSVALFIICICTVCTAYAADKDNAKTPVDIPGLTYDHSMELSYAEEFSVDYYNDGYALITIDQEGQFLVFPEGKKAPKGLEKDITVIQQPLNNIYLVATSAMDLFRAIDGIDSIRLSGTQEKGSLYCRSKSYGYEVHSDGWKFAPERRQSPPAGEYSLCISCR